MEGGEGREEVEGRGRARCRSEERRGRKGGGGSGGERREGKEGTRKGDKRMRLQPRVTNKQ